MKNSGKNTLVMMLAVAAIVLSACGSAPATQPPATDIPPATQPPALPPTNTPEPTATPEPVATPPGGGGMIGFVSDRYGTNVILFIDPAVGEPMLWTEIAQDLGGVEFESGGYPFAWASPCSEQIAYAVSDSAGKNYIEITNPGTGEPLRMQTGRITGISWSPTCRMLLWTQDGVGSEGSFTKGAFIYDLDSGELTMFNLLPAWNPQWASSEIFVVTGGSVAVVADRANWPIAAGNPYTTGTSLSPDNEMIVFGHAPADTEICFIRPNGVDGKCQDFPGYHVLNFVWRSPTELYMIGYPVDEAFDQAARSVFDRIGYVTEYYLYPTMALSPDGLQLAFSGRQCDLDVYNRRCNYPSASEIYLVDLTGPATTDVTDLFTAEFLNGITVHFVDLKSDAVVNLTNDPGSDYAPFWLAP